LGTPSKQPSNYFCKTLTASDTSTHGGFLFFFFLQDYSLQPPAQELIARDLHDNEWKFRHIFRGSFLKYAFVQKSINGPQIYIFKLAFFVYHRTL